MNSLAHKIDEPIIEIPEEFGFLLSKKARYKVTYGGRGGAKSRSYGAALVAKAMEEKHLILCAREVQKSIKDSVKRLIDQQIKRMKVEQYFYSTKTEIKCLLTGTEFIFSGLYQNIDNIKSIEGVTICWVEEAQSVSQASLNILIPTIRTGVGENPDEDESDHPNTFSESELWFSFNPRFETDPVYKMFVIGPPPPSSIVKKVNYDSNPWFPPELRRDMEWDKKIDKDKYSHVWLGETEKHSEKKVFFGYFKRTSQLPKRPKDIAVRYGADWGFSVDPTTLIRFWINSDIRKIFITHEFWGVNVELTDIKRNFLNIHPDVLKWKIIADNSRPETISYVRKQGFNIVACKKGKGSVEDGVSFLKDHEIIIHERCAKTIEEFENYSYKVDRHTGEILPVIEDLWNHCIDAVRYGSEPVMKSGGMFFA